MIEDGNQQFWEGRGGRRAKRTEARALRVEFTYLVSGQGFMKQRQNQLNSAA
jgi:hypothetical protein